MTSINPKITVRCENRTIEPSPEIEWYSGGELLTHPVRIKINGVWKHVLRYDKVIREDTVNQRDIVFRCSIEENSIVEIAVLQ
jgi:hypothetical protein